MGRTRVDELHDLIILEKYITSQKGYEIVPLENPDPNIVEDLSVVAATVLERIQKHSQNIFEWTLNGPAFAYDLAETLFKYNKSFFRDAFREAVENIFEQVGFDTLVQTISRFKYFEQAIYGYQALCDEVLKLDDIDEEKQKLRHHLEKMTTMTHFDELTSGTKESVMRMKESLV